MFEVLVTKIGLTSGIFFMIDIIWIKFISDSNSKNDKIKNIQAILGIFFLVILIVSVLIKIWL